MPEKGIKLTVVDGLFVLLSIALIYSMNMFGQTGNSQAVVKIEPFLMAYCLLRIFFSLSHKWTTNLLLLLIASFCLCQLYLGYSQLFLNLGTNKGQETIVGSFSDSGPFGCFLCCCSSLLVAVYVNVKNQILKISSLIIAVLSFVLMTCTMSRAAMLAFMVSMLFLAMKSDKTIAVIRKYWIYISLGLILLCTGAYFIKKPSADGRLLMAKVGLQMIQRNGVSGVGLGNYAGAYGKAQADFFADYLNSESDELDIGAIPDNLRMVADCPTFAFNEYLRFGIEAGPIAMFLLIGLVVAGVWCSYKRDICWCYPLVSIAVFACFYYPFEVGVLTIIMVVCLASVGSGNNAGKNSIIFYSILFVVFGFIGYTRYKSMKTLNISTHASGVEQLCRNRSKVFWVHDYDVIQDGLFDERLLFACGQALNKSGEYAKSDSILLLGTQISSDPMFWNVMGNNSLAQGKYREAEARYKRAFTMVPNRLYPLYLLTKLYYVEGDTSRFLEMVKTVESFKPKVESVNTERLRSEIMEFSSSF